MKVSLNWLRDYVDITTSVEELAERLTMAGLEVGEIQVTGGDWNNVVVGQIVSIDTHPNADRLRLATVDLRDRQLTVVCGAPNLHVGDKVVFAGVGAKLRDGHSGEVIQLKSAKIRGVVSDGMICSEKELGISDNHEGIMVLSPEAPVGTPLPEYLGDTILDLDITPNRPDCLSVIGIAREIAALTGGRLHIPGIQYDERENAVDSFASVEIAEPDLCPRYCASVLTGIQIGPSPQWLQQRLLASGMRPISNIVDVTNYVMLEYGQPLHAFDCNEVDNRQIIVRRGGDGEIVTTLDGVERTLHRDILVIADKARAIAVAGIMGGAATEITSDTTTVLLESANFNQAVIHEGSISLKLSSEASLRFEKGLSRDLPMVALKRATQMMLELTGAKAAKGIIDIYPGKREEEPIVLSSSEVKRLVGIEMGIDDIIKALECFGFVCRPSESPMKIMVDIPWWRTDISCDADLIEEVARIYGYDNIPTTTLSAQLPIRESIPILPFKQKVRDILVGCGFQEVITYSLTSMEIMRMLSPELRLIGPQPAKVANPMSREQEYLRTTLRAGLLSVIARNQRYQQKGVRVFELGRVFIPRKRDLPYEKEVLCAMIGGLQRELFWRREEEPIDFFIAKGVAETLLSRIGLVASFLPADDESLYPGRTASMTIGNEVVGVVGELHPKVLNAFELTEATYLIEFDIEKLMSLVSGDYKYKTISRYPSIVRDLALLVDKQITYQQVYAIIRDSPLITHVGLFDLYFGKQVPAGKKSLAFRITYQSESHTLVDEEVDEVQRHILDRLAKELGATLRA